MKPGTHRIHLVPFGRWHTLAAMTTLTEIEAAAESLSAGQKQELLLFLAGRLRADGPPLPEPRTFSTEQVAAWIAEDEDDAAPLKSHALRAASVELTQ